MNYHTVKPDTRVIVAQIDDVLSRMKPFNRKVLEGPDSTRLVNANHNIALASATIRRLTPPGSSYQISLESLLSKSNLADYSMLPDVSDAVIGQLQALKSDYQNGYTESIVELVHADLFGDFMEMAQHLLEQGYHIPAAVLIGSTLEENLRKLCLKAGIPVIRQNNKGDNVHLTASSLNDELKKGDVYNNIVHKQVIAWVAVRNNAAHGNSDQFSKQDVDGMYQGVLNFLSQYPA